MDYLLESFDDFCGGEEFIIESSQNLKDMQKAYNDVKKAMEVLIDAAAKLQSEVYYFDDDTITPESSAAAQDAYDSIKGNFNYILNGNLTRYWDDISDNLDKAIKNATVKPKSYKVRIPKEAKFNKKDLETLLRALEIDKLKANNEVHYGKGDTYIMLASRGGGYHGGTALAGSTIVHIMRRILEYMKDGDKKTVSKWVKFMATNTGYVFSYNDPDLYIRWQ